MKYLPLFLLVFISCLSKTAVLKSTDQVKSYADFPFGNLDFEQLNSDSTSGFQYWRIGANTKAVPSQIAVSGKSAILISGSYTEQKPAYFYQHEKFITTQLQRYKISASIKCENISNGGAGLYAYGKKGTQYVGYVSDTKMSGTQDWQRVSIYIWLDESIDHFRIGGQLTGEGKAWFDDFDVTIVPPSQEDMIPEVAILIDSFMTVVKTHSIYRKTKNIDKMETDLRQMCADAKTCEDCYHPMTYFLNQLDNHSFIMPASYTKEWSGSDSMDLPKDIPLASGDLIEEKYGYVKMPGCNAGDSLTLLYFADRMQELIAALDSEHVKGWILDLRENNGGNCWPMLAGIGPLLGEGVCGYFQTESYNTSWYYKNGVSGVDDNNAIVTVSGQPYRLKNENPPIAVLTGSGTASSGEVVTVAFRKRLNTKSFGEATAGLSTGNSNFLLPDGSTLFLCSSVYADREGEAYGNKIRPDVFIPQGEKTEAEDAVLEAALEWLKNKK